MAKINNILVPVDGSEQSKKALDYAKEIAAKSDTNIYVLHVYEIPLPVPEYEYNSEDLQYVDQELKKIGGDILEESIKQIAFTGLKVNKLILMGNNGSQIVSAAEKNNIDLIIMGRRGLGVVKSFLLGSVSNYVVHHTKCPVMIIN